MKTHRKKEGTRRRIRGKGKNNATKDEEGREKTMRRGRRRRKKRLTGSMRM